MNNLQDAFDEAWRIENKAKKTLGPLQTVENITLKCLEELGEVAQAVLKLNKYKASQDAVGDINDNLDEEVVDLMIMTFVLAKNRGLDVDSLLPLFKKKFKKWENTHVNPKSAKTDPYVWKIEDGFYDLMYRYLAKKFRSKGTPSPSHIRKILGKQFYTDLGIGSSDMSELLWDTQIRFGLKILEKDIVSLTTGAEFVDYIISKLKKKNKK